MAGHTIFITGPDPGGGKTVLTALLTRHLRECGVRVVALKPLSSGARSDARVLRAALGGELNLDEINPWHFRAPLAPLVAARAEGRCVRIEEVLAHVRAFQERSDVVLVEGAGGLLTPLGGNFSARDLIVKLRATPLVVCPNRLGALNQTLLVLAALPPAPARLAHVALMSPRRPNAVTRSNHALLEELLGEGRVHAMPWLADAARPGLALRDERVRSALDALWRRVRRA